MTSHRQYKPMTDKETKISMTNNSITSQGSPRQYKLMASYLGQKGYTIYKDSKSPKEIEKIKDQLCIIPKLFMGRKKFAVYRETPNKLYVPRYYGESLYGKLEESNNKILPGTTINVPFRGTLRTHQIPAVNAYMSLCEENHHACGLLELDCAAGKTVLSLYIISLLRKKTLIIVHKEFLLNQWIERIAEFLPSARVGKIQGSVIDIDDKDIVLGMLQSISQKAYDQHVFTSFGLTIIDEVHHISSETFSNTLFKIVTSYMLGLSATMVRKDGTTKVIKMFLGEVIYKGKKEETDEVIVRGIEYKSTDHDFNKIERDYKGVIQYSSMIRKLCDYVPRSRFIVNVVHDLIKENNSKQIMVLGQNRSILYYIHDAIVAANFATVGYYIGGMKQTDLNESSKKNIIICTYAAASEGLDISTLSTLVFATPKSDVVQSVGRILRTRDNNPLIIDIIDQHCTFKSQWKKRFVFYTKCHYKITKKTWDTDANEEDANEEDENV
jgi:superfamily II DNA or RNA helicase